MAIEHQKCTNCGAMLELNSENKIYFCPFCGAKIPVPQDHDDKMIDYSKFVLKHEEEVRKQKVKEKEKEDKSTTRILVGMLIFVAVIFGIVIGRHLIKVANLEKLTAEIQQDVIEGRYDEAAIKVTRIRLDDDWSHEETWKWDQQREALEKLIKQKRGY